MQALNLELTTDDDYVKKNIKVPLMVDLEDLEVAVIAYERGKAENKLAELQADWGDLKKSWQEKLAMQERVVERYGEDIRKKKQERPVLCHEVFNNGSILTVRAADGFVVGQRPASVTEAQRYFPPVEGNTNGVLDAAARAQRANNSQEDEDGDVVPDDGDGARLPKRGRKARNAE